MVDVRSVVVVWCVLRASPAPATPAPPSTAPASTAPPAPYTLDDEEYGLMPPLVSLDEYQPCLRRPGGRFCSAYASFVGEGDNTLLSIMKKYSELSCSRFNHTRAFFGRCVSQNCKNEDTTLEPDRLLEACLNRTLWEQYRLEVKIDSKIHCNEHGEKKPDIKTADIVVAAVIIGLVICNAAGSLLDIFCQKMWKDNFVGQFLYCFSVPRNWRILTAPPAIDDLKGIYGIRAISTYMVIVAHGLLPGLVGPGNPKFIEDLYEWSIFHLLLNGTLIMQTFLFISAFLLVYCTQLQGINVTWRTLPLGLVKRWLRLTPAYMVVLAVTATWLPYMGSGPIWDMTVVEESASCRRSWWQHALYINNYFDDTSCMRQTWYVAADMQLYCLGLAVLACCRSPCSRRLVLAALLLLGLVVPALHTYYQDLDGILLASPSAGAELFQSERTFNLVYKRGHTNLASSVLGLAAGYWALHLQQTGFCIHNYKAWRPLYWLLVPAGMALPISCQVFYSARRAGAVTRALAAALVKPAFGLIVAALVLGLIFKIESVYRGVLEWRGWRAAARASYCAYLVHVAYICATAGARHFPLRMSLLQGSEMVVLTVVAVHVLAGVLWLAVEAPLAHVARACLQRLHHPDTHAGCDKIQDKVTNENNNDSK